jgi:hypothetical protein
LKKFELNLTVKKKIREPLSYFKFKKFTGRTILKK